VGGRSLPLIWEVVARRRWYDGGGWRPTLVSVAAAPQGTTAARIRGKRRWGARESQCLPRLELRCCGMGAPRWPVLAAAAMAGVVLGGQGGGCGARAGDVVRRSGAGAFIGVRGGGGLAGCGGGRRPS
jgi:hypothetical protein